MVAPFLRFHLSLRNHKLCGSPAGCRACSAGYDLRIVFESAQHEGAEAILLLAVGMYDEVYGRSFPGFALRAVDSLLSEREWSAVSLRIFRAQFTT